MRPPVLALALIAAAAIAAKAQTTAPPEPRSCQQLHTETDKCEARRRSCNQHVIDRLQARWEVDDRKGIFGYARDRIFICDGILESSC